MKKLVCFVFVCLTFLMTGCNSPSKFEVVKQETVGAEYEYCYVVYTASERIVLADAFKTIATEDDYLMQEYEL